MNNNVLIRKVREDLLNWEWRQGSDADSPEVSWSCGSPRYQNLCSWTASPFTCQVLLPVWGNTGDREGILCKIFCESSLGAFIWVRSCCSTAGEIFGLYLMGRIFLETVAFQSSIKTWSYSVDVFNTGKSFQETLFCYLGFLNSLGFFVGIISCAEHLFISFPSKHHNHPSSYDGKEWRTPSYHDFQSKKEFQLNNCGFMWELCFLCCRSQSWWVSTRESIWPCGGTSIMRLYPSASRR